MSEGLKNVPNNGSTRREFLQVILSAMPSAYLAEKYARYTLTAPFVPDQGFPIEAEPAVDFLQLGRSYAQALSQNQSLEIKVTNNFGVEVDLFERLRYYLANFAQAEFEREFGGLIAPQDVNLICKGFMVEVLGLSEELVPWFSQPDEVFTSQEEMHQMCGMGHGACATPTGEVYNIVSYFGALFHENVHRLLDNEGVIGSFGEITSRGEGFIATSARDFLLVSQGVDKPNYTVVDFGVMLEFRAELLNQVLLRLFTKGSDLPEWIGYTNPYEDWSIACYKDLIVSLAGASQTEVAQLFKAWGENRLLDVADILGRYLPNDYAARVKSEGYKQAHAPALRGNEFLAEVVDKGLDGLPFDDKRKNGIAFMSQSSAIARKERMRARLANSSGIMPINDPDAYRYVAPAQSTPLGERATPAPVREHIFASPGSPLRRQLIIDAFSGSQETTDQILAQALDAIATGDYTTVNSDVYKYAIYLVVHVLKKLFNVQHTWQLAGYIPNWDAFWETLNSTVGKSTLMGFNLNVQPYAIDISTNWLPKLLQAFFAFNAGEIARGSSLQRADLLATQPDTSAIALLTYNLPNRRTVARTLELPPFLTDGFVVSRTILDGEEVYNLKHVPVIGFEQVAPMLLALCTIRLLAIGFPGIDGTKVIAEAFNSLTLKPEEGSSNDLLQLISGVNLLQNTKMLTNLLNSDIMPFFADLLSLPDGTYPSDLIGRINELLEQLKVVQDFGAFVEVQLTVDGNIVNYGDVRPGAPGYEVLAAVFVALNAGQTIPIETLSRLGVSLDSAVG